MLPTAYHNYSITLLNGFVQSGPACPESSRGLTPYWTAFSSVLRNSPFLAPFPHAIILFAISDALLALPKTFVLIFFRALVPSPNAISNQLMDLRALCTKTPGWGYILAATASRFSISCEFGRSDIQTFVLFDRSCLNRETESASAASNSLGRVIPARRELGARSVLPFGRC